MRSEIGRRTVLAGLTAVSAGQVLGQSLPSDPDVVVIGAGAAGMSAARTLLHQGLTCVVVEAASRIGGRTFPLRHPHLFRPCPPLPSSQVHPLWPG